MIKRFVSVILSIILISGLVSCQNNSQKPEQDLFTTSSSMTVTQNDKSYNVTALLLPEQDASYGSFKCTPDSSGSVITLEARPEPDCGFIGWSREENGEEIISYYNPYTFTVSEDVTVYPVFVKGDEIVELKELAGTGSMLDNNEISSDKTVFKYSELREVTNLHLVKPKTLDFLVYFPSLKDITLHLDPNVSYDTSPLANLVNAESLWFDGISYNFLPLENYKNIKDIYINEYSGDDLYFLAKSKDTLDTLDLNKPDIRNYESLSIFTNLRRLDMYQSQITENDLKYIPETLEELELGSCENIKDLNNLTRLSNLKYLGIGSSWISDIAPIGELKQLKSLSLSYNFISDLSPLSELTELERLNIQNNRVTDLSPLEPLYSRKLKRVIIDYNPITDYSFLNNASCKFGTYENNDELAQAVYTAEAMVEELIKPGMTDEEKYASLVYGLCQKVKYDLDYHGLYSAFIEGKGGCSSYARAYLLLCTLSGLPCYYVGGKAGGLGAGPHSWNIVKVGGSYFHVDPTWIGSWKYDDNNYGYISTAFFLKSDDYFLNNNHYSFYHAPDLICDDTSKDELIGQIRIPLE